MIQKTQEQLDIENKLRIKGYRERNKYYIHRPFISSSYDINSFSCKRSFHEDTLLEMVNGTQRALKDLWIGDRILSWNGSEFEDDIIKDIWQSDPVYLYVMESCRGNNLRLKCSKYVLMVVGRVSGDPRIGTPTVADYESNKRKDEFDPEDIYAHARALHYPKRSTIPVIKEHFGCTHISARVRLSPENRTFKNKMICFSTEKMNAVIANNFIVLCSGHYNYLD